ncbi:monofunctional biosynthetic peptidoglycan transglycosylase [Cyclobacterium sp. 1_MG-2023]|uniref:monofunctional biosynthetic peptidoglycan transglycosylase n=1 Tax=Cyclobacterium sp. 1_MG-2023 TaxID=3062681 RepID=UPI0026E3003C|nr:monofunctional biosynthetic peptidoglycan transglycosylase [Cyclobacterium sp. 1_MG-2023]MDO6440016.1 monofunctional biosynthetic peptidoglycan transglycosylase [Cyclobacterium sp. 1_MG-2023]
MRRLAAWLGKALLILWVTSLLLVLVLKVLPVYFTPLIGIRTINQVFSEKKVVLNKNWVPIEEISPHLCLAVIASEDQKFLSHHGFDWEALESAMADYRTGKRLRGGSTISNQTAKNVFLWPGRNFVRKGLEAYFTVLIELFWSKQRILEVYLNVIEMGDGLYGAEAAAQRYFKKPASKLSRQEAALIAAILPNPIQWRADRPSAYIKKRQAWILRNMNNLGELKLEP